MAHSDDDSGIPATFRTDAYEYGLPEERIAQEPAARREEARLLHLDLAKPPPDDVADRRVADLRELLRAGDLLVLNDTRVVPARLAGIRAKTGGRAEVLILGTSGDRLEILLGTRGKPEPGEHLELAGGELVLALVAARGEGVWTASANVDLPGLRDILARRGKLPLPPYIHREAGADPHDALDRERYQTVYARKEGAVAAPTAGLHLTEALLADLAARGISWTTVTLHVGLGTFRPVKSADLRAHPMHEERYELGAGAATAIRRARAAGGRIVPVGTTSVRVLESAPEDAGGILAASGATRLFIHEPYAFRYADALLTNFHAPRSTLLMLVAAFAGRARILRAYGHAVASQYRFLSYGDAMLIEQPRTHRRP